MNSRGGSAMPQESGRILELDALRGIAALGVVAWHYGVHFGATPLRALLLPFYNAGFLFVDFFLVLSGYVIARAYWRDPRQRQFTQNIVSRLARMYPLHLLTLLATATLLALLPPSADDSAFSQPANDARHFVLNLTLLNQSGLQSGWSFNTPAWSVSAEFIVNVVFLALLAMRMRWRAAVLAFATLGGAALVTIAPKPWIDGTMAFGVLDVNLIRCFLGFAAGAAIYFLVHRTGMGRVMNDRPKSCTLLALASLAALGFLLLGSDRHPPISHYLAAIVASAGCVLFIPFGPLVRMLLRRRFLVFLGDISYSTYLTHYPVQLLVYLAASLGLLRLDYATPSTLLAFFGVVIVVSAATHRFIELPSQRWLLERAARRSPILTSS